MDELMTPDETAGYLRVQLSTLRKWRYSGGGPPAVKLAGYLVRYRRSDVDRWLEQQATESTEASA